MTPAAGNRPAAPPGPGLLRQWIDDSTWTHREVAKRLRCHPSQLSRLLGGTREPRLAMARAIEELTGGTVPMGAWIR